MKSLLFFISFIILLCQASLSQTLPDGYILLYQQGFNNSKSLADFRFDTPASWGIFKISDNYYLQCTGTEDSTYDDTLPANIAIINNKIFGDFILEADVMAEADTRGFREICLFLGIKDPTRYYYVQLANHCDSSNHGIYLVKNSIPVRLTGVSEQPVTWKENKWHKIRLERNIVKRTVLVYFDDMMKPVLQIKDYELIMGMTGIGSFASPARFDNIKIWAPTVITEE